MSGVITRQNKTLDGRTTQFQDRIKNLDKLIEAKRARLERQFAQMEVGAVEPPVAAAGDRADPDDPGAVRVAA